MIVTAFLVGFALGWLVGVAFVFCAWLVRDVK